jgi:hypothetical protein
MGESEKEIILGSGKKEVGRRKWEEGSWEREVGKWPKAKNYKRANDFSLSPDGSGILLFWGSEQKI